MYSPLLLLTLPLQGIVKLWFNPKETDKEKEKKEKMISLSVTIQNLLHIQILILVYDPNISNFQFQLIKDGTVIGGLDGISIWLVFLVNLIIPIVLQDSWKTIKADRRKFKIQVLFVNFWSIAVFYVQDIFLFYISFEALLIPMYFLIGYYGSRNKKIEEAQNKFFLYTLFGSLFLLIALQSIWLQTGTTDYQLLLTLPLSENYQLYLWSAFFLAFAIKTPMWPFHIWLPVAHGESSTGTSVILAAILLKLGKLLPKMTKSFQGFAFKQQWGVNRIGPHNKNIIEIFVGSILGDGHLEYTRTSKTVRLNNTKGIAKIKYAEWLNNYLYTYGYIHSKKLVWYTCNLTGRTVCSIKTVKFSNLVWLHKAFYNNKKKIIPLNIKDYLTPLSLAIWIMDNGSYQSPGIKLATQGLTYEECSMLQNALLELFNLKVSINKSGIPNSYYLYIWKESVQNLRIIVKPFFQPELKSKLGL